MNNNSPENVTLSGSDGNIKIGCTFGKYNAHFQPASNVLRNGASSQLTFSNSGVPTRAILSKGNDTLLQQKWSYAGLGRINGYDRSGINYSDVSHSFDYDIAGEYTIRPYCFGRLNVPL
jgi:hypothetical protein